MDSRFDPYQPLAEGLKFGDVVNRLILLRARQKIVQLLKGQRVLDVCCGTGNLTAMLVAAGCQVVGVDASPTMLSYAQRKDIAAAFQLTDAARLPFDREFDAAVIGIALHEMSQNVRESVWASMRRAVRPRGRLIALDFAVPRHNGVRARIASSLISQDERSFLKIHREHYETFQEFMSGGGLPVWIRERGEAVEAGYDFWGGAIVLVVCRRQEDDREHEPR